jgi:hypothetical protein
MKTARLIENTIAAGRRDVFSRKGYWGGYFIEGEGGILMKVGK